MRRYAPSSTKNIRQKRETTDFRMKYLKVLNTRRNTDVWSITTDLCQPLRNDTPPFNLASETDEHIVFTFCEEIPWWCWLRCLLNTRPRQPNTHIYGNVIFSWLTQARYAIIVFSPMASQANWSVHQLHPLTGEEKETNRKKRNWNNLHRSGPCL